MHYLLESHRHMREGKYIGFSPTTASFDQDIHMPGREKTVEEKNYEKVMAIRPSAGGCAGDGHVPRGREARLDHGLVPGCHRTVRQGPSRTWTCSAGGIARRA